VYLLQQQQGPAGWLRRSRRHHGAVLCGLAKVVRNASTPVGRSATSAQTPRCRAAAAFADASI